MRIERDIKLDYNDVLIRPKRSTMNSRSEVDLCRTYTFLNSGITYTGVPVMASNMHGVGTFAMADALTPMNLFTVLCKDYVGGEVHFWHANSDIKGELCNHVAISTGITDTDWERTAQTLKLNRSLNYLCVDVANGYSERFLDAVSRYRDEYPDITIIAGNVVTPDITEELILRGADIVKVGIGNGSVCTTRIKTGVGYPQLSAVIECADAAHGLGGHIIADGGCTMPGDIAKAFGAGADFVMLGGMLAGTDQGGGEITCKYLNPNSEYFFAKHTESYHPVVQQQDYVQFYGMSSKAAQGDSFQDYRSSEGRIVTVPYRGLVHDIAKDILGGLRSACTYVGARSLKELSKRTTFVQVNRTHNDVYESATVGE